MSDYNPFRPIEMRARCAGCGGFALYEGAYPLGPIGCGNCGLRVSRSIAAVASSLAQRLDQEEWLERARLRFGIA